MKKHILVIFIGAALSVAQSLNTWEDVHIICPNQCVCQHSHFMDLSIARWTQGLKYIQIKDTVDHGNNNSNEVFDENMRHESNPMIKFAMCMLQNSGNSKDVLISLPPEVQALVILYNGVDNNVTVSASDLLLFPELTVLELRGTVSRGLKFILDEPLVRLQYANFETIELIGTETNNRQNHHSVHPSEVFDYVPESERAANYNISIEMAEEEVEIVPYEVYLMEQKKLKMASFYGWKELEILRIHNCQLDELHWEMFDGLTSLEHLSLEHNDIKIIPPFAFYGALHIKTLSLARNSILDMNYRSLAGLLELEWLNLSHNNLTKLSETSFPPFPKLQSVDFRNNPIKYIFPMTFAVMNGTRHISLGNDLTALDMSTGNAFRSLNALRSLFILNATSTVLHQGLFKDLSNLDKLRIHGELNRIEFDAFAEMPNVKELILSDCAIQEVSMDIFFGIRNLEIVDLSNNKLISLPPGLFDDQVNLKEIYLQNNGLTELPKDFFNNPAVRMIRLTENPWVCSCEMIAWKQAITNRIRSGKAPQDCTRNLKTGKVIKCDKSENNYLYTFDIKLSPRCDGGPENVKYRSVYYSLRKTLKCIPSRPLQAKSDEKLVFQPNHLKYKHLTEKMNYFNKYIKPNMAPVSAKEQRMQKMRQKIRKTVNANDLKYLLKSKVATVSANQIKTNGNEADNNLMG